MEKANERENGKQTDDNRSPKNIDSSSVPSKVASTSSRDEKVNKKEGGQDAKALEQARTHLREKEKEIEALESELSSVKRQIKSVQSEKESSQATLKSLRDQQLASTKAVAEAKAEASKSERRLTEVQGELTAANEMIEMLTLEKEELQMEKEMAEERTEELDLEVSRLKGELEQTKLEAKNSADGRYDESDKSDDGTDAAQKLSKQNAELREALARLRQLTLEEKSTLTRRARELESELKEKAKTANASTLKRATAEWQKKYQSSRIRWTRPRHTKT